MDSRLRTLEREAGCGDTEAEKRLWVERLRVGKAKVVNIALSKETGRGGWGSAVSDRSVIADIYYGHLYNWDDGGKVHDFQSGPALPNNGILRSLGIVTDKRGSCGYAVDVYRDCKRGISVRACDVVHSEKYKAGVYGETFSDLWVPWERDVSIGVRMVGDQRSTFSAVTVYLEFWVLS